MSNRPATPNMRLILPATALVALVLTVGLLQLLWPGLMTLAAPLACPAGYPDAFVAKHVFSIPGETRISFSLQCMSANGAIHRGSLLIAMLVWFAGFWILGIARAVLNHFNGRRRSSASPTTVVR